MSPQRSLAAPVTAGVVTAVVGASSSFVVVLAGLTAVGATAEESASGLVALSVALALGTAWLSIRHRTPITLAWSTPGAALLVSGGAVAGGWPAAVGAFAATGALIVLTGLVPRLGDLVAAIPVSLARAMLAGVLLPLCIEPVRALAESPAVVAPVVLTWLVLLRPAPRWAVPASLVAALGVVVVTAGDQLKAGDFAPALSVTAPAWTGAAMLGIALPLYVVTMASQNVPGVAVMRGYGYRVPWRESMLVSGAGTIAAAPFGGHAVNLAAITAALSAGPDAGADRSRRWLAPVAASLTYLLFAAGAGAVTALVVAAPAGVMQSAAGLALFGTLAASLRDALADDDERIPAVTCLVVAASGVSVLGVGAAFWALVAGLVVRATTGAGRTPRRTPATEG